MDPQQPGNLSQLQPILVTPQQHEALARRQSPACDGKGILQGVGVTPRPDGQLDVWQCRLVRKFMLQVGALGTGSAALGIDGPMADDDPQPGAKRTSPIIRGNTAMSGTVGQEQVRNDAVCQVLRRK